jgi:hypothetical protein
MATVIEEKDAFSMSNEEKMKFLQEFNKVDPDHVSRSLERYYSSLVITNTDDNTTACDMLVNVLLGNQTYVSTF